MKILVIGYGNPSRMDDGVGHYVVNRLNEHWGLPTIDLLGEPSGDGSDTARLGAAQVRTMWLQQLDIGLAEDLAAVDKVILVDAHVDGPPLVSCEVSERHAVGLTSHVATPETLLAICRQAYGRRPAATLHTALGERFDFAAELTKSVRERADELVARILSEVDACTK